VRARDVRTEHDVWGGAVRRRDRREVDHRLDARQHLRAAQRLERLAEVGEVGGQERGRRVGRRHEIDVEDVMAVYEEVADHRPPRLAAASGDDDPHAALRSVGACSDTSKIT
jgi:hypothetical protein